MTKTLIDSNVLVYAFTGQDLKKKQTAIKTIQEKIRNNELILSIQNIVETSRICKEKALQKIPDEQIIQNIHYLMLGAEIIYYKPQTNAQAVKISTQYMVHYFDALIIATMLENDVHEIITENTKDFDKIPNLKAINPFK